MTEGQIPLLPDEPPRRTRAPRVRVRHPAAELLPVARVALLTPVPHLDRVFDYEVPEKLAAAAQPGVRVRVRLAGRLVDGFVLERVETSERELQPLSSVHGPAVLTPEIADLCRAVADRYAGTLADVLRFAIPPRHARVESRAVGRPPADPGPMDPVDPAAWAAYRGGAELLAGIGGPVPMRALWVSAPGEQVGARIAELAHAVLARGRGVLVVAPDAAEVDRIVAALVDRRDRAGATRRRVRPGGPLPGLPGRAVGGSPGRGRHPGGGVRPGGRPRGDHRLGRRRRVPGRAAGPRAGTPGRSPPCAAPRRAPPWWSAGPTVTLEGGPDGGHRVAGADRAPAAGPAHPDAAGPGRGRPRRRPGPLARRGSRRWPSRCCATRCARGPVLVSVPRAGYLPMLACQSCREPVGVPAVRPADAGPGPGSAPVLPHPRRRSRTGAARCAAGRWCAPWSSGSGARPRSSVGPCPGSRWSPRRARSTCAP